MALRSSQALPAGCIQWFPTFDCAFYNRVIHIVEFQLPKWKKKNQECGVETKVLFRIRGEKKYQQRPNWITYFWMKYLIFSPLLESFFLLVLQAGRPVIVVYLNSDKSAVKMWYVNRDFPGLWLTHTIQMLQPWLLEESSFLGLRCNFRSWLVILRTEPEGGNSSGFITCRVQLCDFM